MQCGVWFDFYSAGRHYSRRKRALRLESVYNGIGIVLSPRGDGWADVDRRRSGRSSAADRRRPWGDSPRRSPAPPHIPGRTEISNRCMLCTPRIYYTSAGCTNLALKHDAQLISKRTRPGGVARSARRASYHARHSPPSTPRSPAGAPRRPSTYSSVDIRHPGARPPQRSEP